MNKSNKSPLVSVVVTTYNRKELLKETLDSILAQTYSNFELIVVDNYSNYDFFAHINSFNDSRIRPFQNQNNGIIAVNRNFGIKKAKGGYIAFCDDDDLWMPEKLSKQLEYFRQNDVVAVGTSIQLTDKTLKVEEKEVEDKLLSFYDLFYSKSVALSSLIIKKRKGISFIEDKNFVAVEDLEFQIRFLKETQGKLLKLRDELVIYRVAGESMSFDPVRYSNLINVITKYKEDLPARIYNDALYFVYLKIGLKYAKVGLNPRIFFRKSACVAKYSFYKRCVSLSLLVFSFLPGKLRLNVLKSIYKKKLMISYAYKRLS